jgi:signal transduction histidine kinase
MRPPALDELGLVSALRQRAASMRTEDGRAMHVSVEAPDALPGLPAAVETAAYRIATEALANAARHSGSDQADLRIGVTAGRLSVTVRDRGRAHEPWAPGVGVSSMKERAAEVGGTLTINADDGFSVQALLPLA